MSLRFFTALTLLLLWQPVHAQDSDQPLPDQPAATAATPKVSGATIPVMRAPDANSVPDLPVSGAARWGVGNGMPSQGGTQIAPPATATAPAMTITRPVSETPAPEKPLPKIETPSQIAADQAIRKQADSEISDYAGRVSETCEASFKARIDWTLIDPQEIHVSSPQDACGAALQAIDELCGTEAAKRRVAQQIKMVICTAGPTPSVELHAGTLLYTIDWQGRNPGQTVYTWLDQHL